MRRALTALVGLTVLFGIAAAPTAQAQPGPSQRGSLAVEPVRELAQAAETLAIAQQILQAREEALQREAFGQSFRQHWLDRLARLSVAQLVTIAAAGPTASLEESIAASSQTVLADAGIQSLGDSGADLVYTKVTPCRIADTRVAGGALGTGSSRNFFVVGGNTALFALQGGAPCGIPIGATSVAMNVTVVSAAGYGWLRVYPYGGSGNASVINYKAGDTIANGLVLPLCDPATATCTLDLTLAADSFGAHVLLDVMGYFQDVNKANYRSFTVVTGPGPGSGNLNTTPIAVRSLTLTAPGPGQVVVRAYANLWLTYSLFDDAYVNLCLSTSSASCTGTSSPGFVGNGLEAANGTHQLVTVGEAISTIPAAGTYTFYLLASRPADSSAQVLHNGMTATFHPQ